MKKRLINSVVPHEHNRYTPSLLQRFAMGGMAFLVVLSFAATNILAILWQNSDWLVGAVLPGVVATLTNEERAAESAAPLVRSRLLDEAAKQKAEHMAAEGYFAHYSPGGISPWHWFEEVGYSYAHAGENLAVHFSDSDEVVKAWMNSPTHRANIVNSNYTEIGIGVAKGKYEGYDTVFVVQMFGMPAVPAPLPIVAEPAPLPVFVKEEIREVAIYDTASATLPVSTTTVLGIETHTETEAMADPEPETSLSDSPMTEIAIQDDTDMEELLTTPLAVAGVFETGLVATSTDLEPTSSSLVSQSGGTTAPMMARLATQPNKILQYIYIGIGSVTALLLLISIVVGWRRGVITQVWYGVGLLIMISVLFAIHAYVTSGALII